MCSRCGHPVRAGEDALSYPRVIPGREGGVTIQEQMHVVCPDGIWD